MIPLSDQAIDLLLRIVFDLRLRRTGKRWVQTIKGPPEPLAGAGLAARAEHEWPLARTQWTKFYLHKVIARPKIDLF